MRIASRRWPACLLLMGAALLMSLGAGLAPPADASESSMLDPANPVFDLEDQGLKPLWVAELGRISEPRLKALYPVDGWLVAETPTGEVHVLDARRGTWKNMQVFARGLKFSPIADGDRMLVVSASRLYPFDPATGQVGEGHRLAAPPFAPPRLWRDTIIVPTGNGLLTRLSRPDYRRIWLSSIRGPIWHQPTMVGGRVFASASEVICVQAEDGLELWRWEPRRPARLNSGIAVHEGRVYVGDNLGDLYALGAEFGDLRWQKSLGAPIVGRPRVVEDRLLVFTSKPAAYCVSLEDEREVLWSYEGATELVTAGRERLYLRTDDNGIAAVSADRGEELWKDVLPADCLVSGDPERAVFYVANRQGTIAAFEELD